MRPPILNCGDKKKSLMTHPLLLYAPRIIKLRLKEGEHVPICEGKKLWPAARDETQKTRLNETFVLLKDSTSIQRTQIYILLL